mgnify:CR=1 FL=1
MESSDDKHKRLSSRRERAIIALIISIAIIIGFGFFISDPSEGHMRVTFPTGHEISLFNCPFRELTGLPCPICGLTRSTALAVRGYPLRSFRVTPLGIIVVLLSIYGIIRAPFVLFGAEIEPDEKIARRRNRIITTSILVILALSWAITLARHFELIKW